MRYICLILIMFFSHDTIGQEIAVMKYKGGGDWYSNPTALPNLVRFCNAEINTSISEKIPTVTPDSPELFNYPYIYLTGHGNIFFTEKDAQNLRNYLLSGGFLHVDDNYGLEPYFRKALKTVFPDKILEEISADHPIFSQTFSFPKGLPKIHVHDGKPPQLFGITHEDRLILIFSYESDLGNGWEDPEVHNDPEEVRQKALKMGANIIKYVFSN
ncbi:DUF4159 domain-containing protein [Mesohalobacter halotolerans]|uniref:DUF4159 domain-containing protein n=1 Tax=Mesohalobacter halotolerans TaxID=1883405 RepID=A0A4U5TQS2_9FLAO|nr:DUF4159 domain-containing protein [Mesohalobacter halotolerans]TKS56559.1 DUF4159 domain-containing protein [Mesohalobacter halotolerans]